MRLVPRGPFTVDVLGRIHAGPVLLAQALQFENRQRLGGLERPAEQQRDLLGDGPPLALRPDLQFLVEAVRQVLDVERGHGYSVYPPLWRNRVGSTSYNRRVRCPALRPGSPTTTPAFQRPSRRILTRR